MRHVIMVVQVQRTYKNRRQLKIFLGRHVRQTVNGILSLTTFLFIFSQEFLVFILILVHTREHLQFPTIVNGFDRCPDHVARSALYTKYTPSEWHKSCITSYTDADVSRCRSEKLRVDAERLIRETEEVTQQGQREASRRLGERLTDLNFWRNELTMELEKVIAEYSLLMDMKRRTTKSLNDLDAPLKIAEECLYFRENRQGIEKVHDNVEKSLLDEVQNLKSSQNKLKDCLEQVKR